jgi:hypothetical protein
LDVTPGSLRDAFRFFSADVEVPDGSLISFNIMGDVSLLRARDGLMVLGRDPNDVGSLAVLEADLGID